MLEHHYWQERLDCDQTTELKSEKWTSLGAKSWEKMDLCHSITKFKVPNLSLS